MNGVTYHTPNKTGPGSCVAVTCVGRLKGTAVGLQLVAIYHQDVGFQEEGNLAAARLVTWEMAAVVPLAWRPSRDGRGQPGSPAGWSRHALAGKAHRHKRNGALRSTRGSLPRGPFLTEDKHWLCLRAAASPSSCLLGMTGLYFNVD